MHCLKAFPENPGLHWQLNPPRVLVQMAFLPQRPEGPFIASHSFISNLKRIQILLIIHKNAEILIIFNNISKHLPTHPAAMSFGLKVQPSSQIQ